mmetsp:Transcript_50441/g.114888  ORF Transcript_50441/g.114888 Transcript_50441/m.114888 type:complete len:233 (-) Transcript_50441:45-743(-)
MRERGGGGVCGCLCGTRVLLLGWGSAGRCVVWEPLRPADSAPASPRAIPRRALIVGSLVGTADEDASAQASLLSLARTAATTAARCGRRAPIIDFSGGGASLATHTTSAHTAHTVSGTQVSGHSRTGGKGIVPLEVVRERAARALLDEQESREEWARGMALSNPPKSPTSLQEEGARLLPERPFEPFSIRPFEPFSATRPLQNVSGAAGGFSLFRKSISILRQDLMEPDDGT